MAWALTCALSDLTVGKGRDAHRVSSLLLLLLLLLVISNPTHHHPRSNRKDLEHWFRAESASDPSNAALLAAYTVHGGPLNPPNRGPAPGLVTDQATIEAEAARAFAESQQRISTARGGAFGPAGAEVESIHAEDVPVWAKLVVGGDSSGGVDGGLPVWAQDIKDALPPSVLEQVAAGVKGQDSKKVKEALQSLTPAEKERLGETVRGIPPVGLDCHWSDLDVALGV